MWLTLCHNIICYPSNHESLSYIFLYLNNKCVCILCYVQYRFECPNVYTMLDKTDDAIIAFEMEMATLAKQASLFDVYVPDFKQLKMCRKEIKMLKVWN